MKPSIGRIVHFVFHGMDAAAAPRCYAAIITDVCDNPGGTDPETDTPCVDLDIRHRLYHRFVDHVPHCEDATQVATWHWPERVES